MGALAREDGGDVRCLSPGVTAHVQTVYGWPAVTHPCTDGLHTIRFHGGTAKDGALVCCPGCGSWFRFTRTRPNPAVIEQGPRTHF